MTGNKNRSAIPASSLILGIILFCYGAVSAAAPRFGEDTWNLKVGAFLSDFDTELSLTGPNGGAGIDLEDDLGLDSDQTSFRGELMWRFAPRHRVILGYYRFDRSTSGSVRGAIEIDDPDEGLIEIGVGVEAEAEMDWQLIPLSYAYSFYKTDKIEAAATLGVHWFDVRFGIEGTATLNGTPNQFVSESESASGPLPVFGLRADYALTPQWLIGGHAQYFTLDYDDYSGDLLDLRLQTEYWFTDNVGAGLGYTWYDIGVTVDEGDGYELGVDYTYRGLEAYLAVRF
jgi:hypothetical protein